MALVHQIFKLCVCPGLGDEDEGAEWKDRQARQGEAHYNADGWRRLGHQLGNGVDTAFGQDWSIANEARWFYCNHTFLVRIRGLGHCAFFSMCSHSSLRSPDFFFFFLMVCGFCWGGAGSCRG